MYKATAGIVLPTTITGSLPRPNWYTQNLGGRNFREAMVDRFYREQYLDAVSAFVRDQETAGLDIITDGDCRFDADVGGHNWFSYPPLHMTGFAGAHAYKAQGGRAGMPNTRGHILHDVLEARIMPGLVGPVGRGTLEFSAVWKAAQRQTKRPVKFGTITAELIAMAVRDFHYKDSWLKFSIARCAGYAGRPRSGATPAGVIRRRSASLPSNRAMGPRLKR